jgi:hypothetical protein
MPGRSGSIRSRRRRSIAGSLDHAVPGPLEERAEEVADDRLVVEYEDRHLGAGSVTVKREPRPGPGSTESVPAWARMISRARTRPRPAPPCALLVE